MAQPGGTAADRAGLCTCAWSVLDTRLTLTLSKHAARGADGPRGILGREEQGPGKPDNPAPAGAHDRCQKRGLGCYGEQKTAASARAPSRSRASQRPSAAANHHVPERNLVFGIVAPLRRRGARSPRGVRIVGVGEGAGQLRAYPRTSALSLEEPTKIPTFAWAGPVNKRAGTPVRGRMPLGVGHSGPQRTPSARPRSRALAWHGAAKPLTEKIKGMVGAG